MQLNRSRISLIYIVFIYNLWGNIGIAEAQSGDPPAGHQTLIFGFLPILSAERLVTRFAPLVDYLSQRSHRDIRMETAPDFAEFIRRTQHGRRYDILFTAPHFFYLAEHDRGYRGLVRVDRPGMKAVVVVPAGSSINSLQDLRGRALATTGPMALSTLLIRDLLTRAGLDPDKDLRLVPTPSHIAALLSSQQGTTDASAVMLPVFRHARPDIRDSMRVVAESGMAPHIPLGVAPWVGEDVGRQLQAILIDMPNVPEGREVLKHLEWPGFVPVGAHEYDSVRWLAEQIKVN
jgi:phosphonate transport system substrate-binding protein